MDKKMCIDLVSFHRKQTPRVCILLASAILLSAVLTGCDLFMNKGENDLLSEIDDALDYANASVLRVSVDEGGMGTAVPRGSIAGVKQGYPFTLSYTAKTEYPFLGWQARLEGSSVIISAWEPGGSAGEGITWEPVNDTGTEIRVTILIDPGKTILIGPLKASMPFVNVTVEDVVSGVSTPEGVLAGVIKQDIPFSLRFNPYPAYGFIGWETSLDGVPLGQEAVEFSNRKSMETTVTVHINPGVKTVIIRPLGEGANSVWDFIPNQILHGDGAPDYLIKQNQYIQIRFTKPIARESFWFNDYKNVEGDFDDRSYGNAYFSPPIGILNYKNITIRGNLNSPYGTTNFLLEKYYMPPVLSVDGTVLTLWARPQNNGIPWFSYKTPDTYTPFGANSITVEVTADGNIRDTAGLTMGSSRKWAFSLKKVGDTNAYTALPAYGVTSTPPTYLPSVGNTLGYIKESLTGGTTIDPRNIILTYTTSPDLVSGANKFLTTTSLDHWIYVIFQADYTPWPVIGARVIEWSPGNVDSSLTTPSFDPAPDGEGSDVKLLEDGPLKDKIIAAYSASAASHVIATGRPAEGVTGELPIYVARYKLSMNDTETDTFYGRSFTVFARVAGEVNPGDIFTKTAQYALATHMRRKTATNALRVFDVDVMP
jgi:hypothetical protein